MKYPWILFDADDTLFHFDAYQGLKRMFSGLQVVFDEDDYIRYQQINKPLWVDYQAGRISATDLQVTRFSEWAARLAMDAAHLNSRFLAAMAETCTLLPGAAELVRGLRGKAMLGIITNGFTELQTARLLRTGLHDAFATVVISEQVGVAKPDRRIFDHALALMDDPPREQVLMIGDNPHSDIRGGLAAGIHTCWFNPSGHAAPDGIRPHYQVSHLSELDSLVR